MAAIGVLVSFLPCLLTYSSPRIRVATQHARIFNRQQPEDPEWKAGGDDTLKIGKLTTAVDLVLGGRLAELSYPEYSVCSNVGSNPGSFVVIINLTVTSL
jgi:hypothetical protein